jgi:hypothetical protein
MIKTAADFVISIKCLGLRCAVNLGSCQVTWDWHKAHHFRRFSELDRRYPAHWAGAGSDSPDFGPTDDNSPAIPLLWLICWLGEPSRTDERTALPVFFSSFQRGN